MHPRMPNLVAYRDGALPAKERSKLASHLENCARCRQEVERMEAELLQFAVMEVAACGQNAVPERSHPPELLAALRVRRQEREDSQAGLGEASIEQRLTAQLETFFGRQMASAIGSQSPHGLRGPALVRAAESLLTTFLGRRATSVLMDGAVTGVTKEELPTPGVPR